MLRSIAFSPDGTRVATGGEEEVVRVFDAADGRQHAALFTGAMQVSGLAFSPDGRRLYAAGWGMGGVKVFDPARDPRGRPSAVLENQIGAMTFDREGLRVLQVDWLARRTGRRGPGRWQRPDRSDPPCDGCPPLAPRGLRLQSPTAGGWRRRRGGTGRGRGLGRGPRAAGRHAAGIGRAGHGRRVRPRRPVAGDRGGRRGRRGGRS